jgi:hypothetical protein
LGSGPRRSPHTNGHSHPNEYQECLGHSYELFDPNLHAYRFQHLDSRHLVLVDGNLHLEQNIHGIHDRHSNDHGFSDEYVILDFDQDNLIVSHFHGQHYAKQNEYGFGSLYSNRSGLSNDHCIGNSYVQSDIQ